MFWWRLVLQGILLTLLLVLIVFIYSLAKPFLFFSYSFFYFLFASSASHEQVPKSVWSSTWLKRAWVCNFNRYTCNMWSKTQALIFILLFIMHMKYYVLSNYVFLKYLCHLICPVLLISSVGDVTHYCRNMDRWKWKL